MTMRGAGELGQMSLVSLLGILKTFQSILLKVRPFEPPGSAMSETKVRLTLHT